MAFAIMLANIRGALGPPQLILGVAIPSASPILGIRTRLNSLFEITIPFVFQLATTAALLGDGTANAVEPANGMARPLELVHHAGM
jgi:hypothetical protein